MTITRGPRATSPTTVLATVSVSALLAVAGCSSGGSGRDGDDGGTSTPTAAQDVLYDFTQAGGVGPAKTITIEVPHELHEVATAEGNPPLVTSAEVTGREIPGESCAADVAFTFADGGLETLRDYGRWEKRRGDAEGGDEASVDQIASSRFAGFNDNTIGEPDGSSPEEGTYFSRDLATMTLVRDCSASPNDTELSQLVAIPSELESDEPETLIRSLAEICLTLMEDGTVGLPGSQISHYRPGQSGEWASAPGFTEVGSCLG